MRVAVRGVMSLHKLSAGDGYTYLTRQVAAADDTHHGRGSLGEYWEQKGESPGVRLGSGVNSLTGELPETVVAANHAAAALAYRLVDASAIARPRQATRRRQRD